MRAILLLCCGSLRMRGTVSPSYWRRKKSKRCRPLTAAGHPSDDQLDAATWCRHLVPDGSVYAFLADHRHQLFPPELFADVVRHG
jgi:hypothetical protein